MASLPELTLTRPVKVAPPGPMPAGGRSWSAPAARDQGGDELGDGGEDYGQPGRDEELGHYHRGPAHRRGQQVDDAAVVDFGAEHAGADDQRGERQQHREPERAQDVRRPRPRRRARGLEHDREQDQDRRGEREQQRSLAAQRRAQGDPRDRGVEQARHAAPWLSWRRGRRRRFPGIHRWAAPRAAGRRGRGPAPRCPGRTHRSPRSAPAARCGSAPRPSRRAGR